MDAAPTHPAARGFRTRHGGLWTDRVDAPAVLAARRASGALSASDAEALGRFVEDGFVVLERAVPGELVDRVEAAIERAWTGRDPLVRVAHPGPEGELVEPPRPELRAAEHKLLNLHAVAPAARAAIFAPAIARFLALLFERPPLAFASLVFERGTRQPFHQDTAFVGVQGAPLELAASWIALEDVRAGSGELEYYVGSHRLPPLEFDGERRMPAEHHGDPAYPHHLHAECEKAGLELRRFLPRRGDALIWAADLVHGGRRDREPGTTRRSLVTHYCPVDRDPDYFAFWRHSEKRAAETPGAFWCHYER